MKRSFTFSAEEVVSMIVEELLVTGEFVKDPSLLDYCPTLRVHEDESGRVQITLVLKPPSPAKKKKKK